MFSETFYPMAARNSVPRVARRYHFQHLPPPDDPTEFMEELRHGLRGVKRAQSGFWGKVKSVAWRFLLKFEAAPEPFRRPDFPVAAPPTPVPRFRQVCPTPDIYIIPPGCLEYILSPPLPQDDGFLLVPPRSFRAPRERRRERSPPSSRPLPTPPGPPACPLPEIKCCPWANSPTASSQASPSPTSTTSEAVASTVSGASDSDSESDAEDRFFDDVAPFLFLVDGGSDDEGEYEPLDLDWAKGSASSPSDKAPGGAEDDAMTPSSAEAEETRDVSADEEFLGELGLDWQSFMSLLILDQTGMQRGEGEADRD